MKKNHESARFRLNDRRKQLLTSFLFLLMIMLSSATFGQNSHSIKGQVLDSKQEPLIGATIMLKGNSSSSTVTDLNGQFVLNVSGSKPILIISYIGMESQEVEVLGKNNISIVLKDKNINMDEVIVVGYGTQRKADLSSAISILSPSELTKVVV